MRPVFIPSGRRVRPRQQTTLPALGVRWMVCCATAPRYQQRFHSGAGHLTASEAATLPCAAVTAWAALLTRGRLIPGEHVLVQGTGGVAVFAVQFAKAMGATVTVISSSDEKLAKIRELGADYTVNYTEHPQWSER